MIELKNVSRMYARGTKEIEALHDITLAIKRGEFLSVMGPSGSGKSTLLNIIGGLDQPTSGEVFIDDRPLHGISDDDLTLIRRRRVGFVFQFFNLLPILTAAENVCLPLLLEGIPFARVKPKAESLLRKVGLGERFEHRPEQLSGGEMQMLAIARTLMGNPELILVDEPTEGLAPLIVEVVGKVIREINGSGTTVLLVEQKLQLVMGLVGRIYIMSKGTIQWEGTPEILKAQEEIRKKYLEV